MQVDDEATVRIDDGVLGLSIAAASLSVPLESIREVAIGFPRDLRGRALRAAWSAQRTLAMAIARTSMLVASLDELPGTSFIRIETDTGFGRIVFRVATERVEAVVGAILVGMAARPQPAA